MPMRLSQNRYSKVNYGATVGFDYIVVVKKVLTGYETLRQKPQQTPITN